MKLSILLTRPANAHRLKVARYPNRMTRSFSVFGKANSSEIQLRTNQEIRVQKWQLHHMVQEAAKLALEC